MRYRGKQESINGDTSCVEQVTGLKFEFKVYPPRTERTSDNIEVFDVVTVHLETV